MLPYAALSIFLHHLLWKAMMFSCQQKQLSQKNTNVAQRTGTKKLLALKIVLPLLVLAAFDSQRTGPKLVSNQRKKTCKTVCIYCAESGKY